MATAERTIDYEEILSRIFVIREVLLHGKKRASAGCVASESLNVFNHALLELEHLNIALSGGPKGIQLPDNDIVFNKLNPVGVSRKLS